MSRNSRKAFRRFNTVSNKHKSFHFFNHFMRENPIVSRFQEKDLKKINEDIKSENIKLVYNFFNCKSKRNYPHRGYCGDCPYLYKKDIRVPNLFGCDVADYIKMIDAQLSRC